MFAQALSRTIPTVLRWRGGPVSALVVSELCNLEWHQVRLILFKGLVLNSLDTLGFEVLLPDTQAQTRVCLDMEIKTLLVCSMPKPVGICPSSRPTSL